MDDEGISRALGLIKDEYPKYRLPLVSDMVRKRKDPFRILIGTVLSLRTKDEVTSEATERLFEVADTPEEILNLDTSRIEELIYPVGFYRNKARTLHSVCRDLINRFDGKVPDDLDELLSMKGVGRKTANLVITMGYDKPGICVDTHVHRICNRFGYVDTKTPDETEMALRKKLPIKHWIEINDLLVVWGQNVCKPISPFCSRCVVNVICERVGVHKSR
jgi:endonuclease-3